MSQVVVNLDAAGNGEDLSYGEKFSSQLGEVEGGFWTFRSWVVHASRRAARQGGISPFIAIMVVTRCSSILSGNGEYRFGEDRIAVRAEAIAWLRRPGSMAHQIINTGSEPLRYLGFSNNESFD